MSDIEIVNPVPATEMAGWTASFGRTFLRPPDPEPMERMRGFWTERLSPDRTWGARADGQWVATLATETRMLTIPAADGGTGVIAVDALTAVSTSATHRRRRLLSTMIGQSLHAAHDRGDPLSILIAAEWPIYGRYGYGPAARFADIEYRPRQPNSAIAPADTGSVRYVERDELGRIGPAAFDRIRTGRPGQIDRPPFWWSRHLTSEDPDSRHHLLVHERAGVVDGLMAWKASGDFELDGSLATVNVHELVAADAIAYRNLWAHLAGIDVVDKIVLRNRPTDEPARWMLTDGRALRETYAGDVVWVRLLDVPAALTARGYAAPGRIVLDVTDAAEGAYAAGRYVLDAGPGGASCERTTEPADVQLPATVLASAYLGGYRLTPIAAAGTIDEVTLGALARLDAMFATPLEPWCATGF